MNEYEYHNQNNPTTGNGVGGNDQTSTNQTNGATGSTSPNSTNSDRPTSSPYVARPTAEQPMYASSRPESGQNLYGSTTPQSPQQPYQNPQRSYSAPQQNQQSQQSQPNWNAYRQAPSNTFYGAAAQPPHKKSKAPMIVAIVLAGMILATGCGFGGAFLANKLSGGEGGEGKTVVTQSLVNSANDNSDISAVAANTMNSVVEITTEIMSTNNFMQQYVSEGAGSGVIISKDGYIVTNNHVIDGATKVSVRTKLGDTYDATIVGSDPDSDLAVLKVEATNLNAAVYGDSDQLTIGEMAVAIGNPLGSLGGTVTSGIISALDREITIDGQTLHLLQTSAAINPGNSGGGLFNEKGELIGIVNAKSAGSGIEGLGFAIPVNTAKEVINDLIEHGYVTGRVQLGVSLLAIEDEQTAMMYRVSEIGVYIAQVSANSDAYYGGLQVGDLVKSVNGKRVETTVDVKDIVSASSVNDQLSFQIMRNGKSMTIEVTLTEYNSKLDSFVQ